MRIENLGTPTPILTIDEMRQHLRLDTTEDDGYVAGLVMAATAYVEEATGTAIMQRAMRLTLNEVPATGIIRMPNPPLVSISKVTVAGRVLNASEYVVDSSALPGRIIVPGPIAGPVQIEFTAGYVRAQIPATLKVAVRMLAAYWFETREAATDRRIDNVPFGIESIINLHRVPEVI